MDYLHLYIIHWPFSFEADEYGLSKCDENGVAVVKLVSIKETWSAMEERMIINEESLICRRNW